MKEGLYNYLLMLGDNSMILGHRLSELCGHGPNLETDIALTNISLDLFGQVRSYFQYAAKIAGRTEDDIAFLRREREYRNVLLVEQPNENFAHVIVRQFLFDVYHKLLLTELRQSKEATIAAIAEKSIKESKYHTRFSSEWMKRLGGGTDKSHALMQDALDHLYPFAGELFLASETEVAMKNEGIGADVTLLKTEYDNIVSDVVKQASLEIPASAPRVVRGKTGIQDKKLEALLWTITDPEIPVLSILDMGIVRAVDVESKNVKLKLTPTYSGCPAMDTIAADIGIALEEEGYSAQIEFVLAPAWTTDWITERGRKKLEEYGIAAPLSESADKSAIYGEAKIVKCTNCGSQNTQLISQFGSTACKALFKCNECLEPFDYFKCLK